MKRLALLAVLALCLPFTAHADDASRHAKAEEMVTLLHSDRMVQQISANFMKQISAAGDHVIGPNPTQEKKDELTAFENKFSGMIDGQIGWSVLKPALVDIYASTFTEDQLTAIVTFYKSPAGSALVDKMPSVNTQASQLIQGKLATLQPQMKQMFEDFQQSQAAPHPAPSLGPPTGSAPPTTPSPQK